MNENSRFCELNSIEFDSLSDYGFTYCGIPVAHSYAELLVIEHVLFKSNIKTIVELGVWYGGVSTLFLTTAAKYLGYDNADNRYPLCKKLFNDFGHTFKIADVLTSDTVFNEIKEFVGDDSFLLYIDNGNKAEEIKKYIPLLKEGDVCIAHDFEREWFFPQIIETVKQNNITILCPQTLSRMRSHQLMFIKELEKI